MIVGDGHTPLGKPCYMCNPKNPKAREGNIVWICQTHLRIKYGLTGDNLEVNKNPENA